VHGEYASTWEELEEPAAIEITYGYSPDHRPDLKQFLVELMWSGDGDLPLYLAVAEGNQAECAMFARMLKEFRQQWQIERLLVADAALYSEENLQQMHSLRWLSLVRASLKVAQLLLEHMDREAIVVSDVAGYQMAECCSDYGALKQRWLMVESQARKQADLKQLDQRLAKQLESAHSQLPQLCQQEFACEQDAVTAARGFENQLRFHQLAALEVIERKHHTNSGRPRQQAQPTYYCDQIRPSLVPPPVAIATEQRRAGRFILATNVLDANELSNSHLLHEYKAQQSSERGFRFLKDPLFFTSSIFLNSPQPVAALAMVMGLA
jgi:transposase